jgi:uracil-DNA glycosylase
VTLASDGLAAANRLVLPLSELLAQARSGSGAGSPFGDWQPLIDDWRASEAGRALIGFVDARVAAGAVVYPAAVFRALALTPRGQVRVVVLGQDPYHGPGQAEGLAFSVGAQQRIPPSLRNIFKELQRDLGLAPPAHGQLGAWAARGVLLLNTTLTVEHGQPGSHARRGWEALTDRLIAAVAQATRPTVFMLWGAHAQAKAPLIASAGAGHLVLQSNHPSPLAALRPPLPFIGCGHFSVAREFLARQGGEPLDWALA